MGEQLAQRLGGGSQPVEALRFKEYGLADMHKMAEALRVLNGGTFPESPNFTTDQLAAFELKPQDTWSEAERIQLQTICQELSARLKAQVNTL